MIDIPVVAQYHADRVAQERRMAKRAKSDAAAQSHATLASVHEMLQHDLVIPVLEDGLVDRLSRIATVLRR